MNNTINFTKEELVEAIKWVEKNLDLNDTIVKQQLFSSLSKCLDYENLPDNPQHLQVAEEIVREYYRHQNVGGESSSL